MAAGFCVDESPAPIEVEEQPGLLKCFTVLCYHNPSSGACRCVLFTAGLQGSWSVPENNVLNFRFGTEAGKHWKCLLFCSLAGRIRGEFWGFLIWPGAEWQCPLATRKDRVLL